DELDNFFREKVHKHVDMDFVGNKMGHFTNVYMAPIMLGAQSDTTINMSICLDPAAIQDVDLGGRISALIKQTRTDDSLLLDAQVSRAGLSYLSSVQRLRATMYMNIVFPIYTSERFIKHFTPGKNWNSLYTWDSGFIGLGLNEVDLNLGLENINAYTTN